MSNDLISRQYLLDIATAEGAYDYVSAHDVANAPTAYEVILCLLFVRTALHPVPYLR